jgi:predicted ATPase
MGRPIDKITLKGFKSIKCLENFELEAVNVLIGANGCGKTNFVSFFKLLRELVEGRLEKAVNKAGGADVFLYLGPQVTEKIEADLCFGMNAYKVVLEPTNDNRLLFDDERIRYFADPGMRTMSVDRSIGSGHSESKLKEQIDKDTYNKAISEHIYSAVSSWIVYHFHDTSETAALRRTCSVRDTDHLRQDGANLAAFLYWLKEEEEDTYDVIRATVRLVAPFFDDFVLRPKKQKDDTYLQLEWKQVESDFPFHPSQLSDGTLRFIALATALLQPDPPATVLIDEPELGLHPYALDVLANLILQAQERTQIIVSTQSAPLLNAFEPEHIVVIERHEGESTFRRLDKEELKEWMTEDYTLSDLWQKNVYGGGPAHE